MKKHNYIITQLKFSNRYLFIPIVLIVFFFLFYLVYEDIKERTINEFNKEQLILAETASQGITSFFSDYQYDFTFLSQLNEVIDFTDNGKSIIKKFYENQKEYIKAITRVDAKGVILYTYPFNQSVIGKDISSQKHVSQIIKTHQAVLSDVFMSVQGYLAIALHVPIFKDKEYKGSLALLIPINKLGERYLGKIKIRGNGNVWLLSEDGVEIYCPIKEHVGRSFLDITHHDSLSVKFLETIKKQNNGIIEGIHQEVVSNGIKKFNKKYMTFYRIPIGNTYWTIVISYQKQDIYNSLASLRDRLVYIFLLLFIFMTYYFYSLSKVRNILKEESKRKKAESTLRVSENKFKNIFNNLQDAYIETDFNGKLILVSPSAFRIFGYNSENELIGLSIESLYVNSQVRDELNHLLSSKLNVQDFVSQGKRKDGSVFWVSMNVQKQFDENDKFKGTIIVVRDITDRKQAEEEILMLAHSLKSVSECVSITDIENKIKFVNEAFCKTYGYDADELIDKSIEIILSSNNSSDKLNEILQDTNAVGRKGELMNKRKNGNEFPIHLSTNTIKDKNDIIIGFIRVASDITDLKRNENELIKAKERAEEAEQLKTA
ncbi:MAG: PAS domain-containing protein, partial [Bacteroidales bacterium]